MFIETHPAGDHAHPVPHPERGIAGAQHQCAEAHQGFREERL
jgi:hypothetical protein